MNKKDISKDFQKKHMDLNYFIADFLLSEKMNQMYDEEIWEEILYDILNGTNLEIKFDESYNSPSSKMHYLMYYIIYRSEYVDAFYEILEMHRFNKRREIKSAMSALAHLQKPDKNKATIDLFLNLPMIQDISFNGKNEFTIFSEKYGKFVFELASYYFRKNIEVTDYIQNNPLLDYCHEHAYFMSFMFEKMYAITSLCQSAFEGTYLHSYVYDKEKKRIIDLCSNCVMDESSYYDLFQPKEISVIQNRDVVEELSAAALKANKYPTVCSMIKIALYRQHIKQLNPSDFGTPASRRKVL